MNKQRLICINIGRWTEDSDLWSVRILQSRHVEKNLLKLSCEAASAMWERTPGKHICSWLRSRGNRIKGIVLRTVWIVLSITSAGSSWHQWQHESVTGWYFTSTFHVKQVTAVEKKMILLKTFQCRDVRGERGSCQVSADYLFLFSKTTFIGFCVLDPGLVNL